MDTKIAADAGIVSMGPSCFAGRPGYIGTSMSADRETGIVGDRPLRSVLGEDARCDRPGAALLQQPLTDVPNASQQVAV